ncbi:MAG: FtsQ-type POTRA domain-containing protein [Lentisphaerota bacterium]
MAASNAPKNEPKHKKDRQKLVRVALFLLGMAAIIAACFFSFQSAYRALFAKNEHFIVRSIEVSSSGWWNGQSKLIAERLGMVIGRDNLFSSDLRDLRARLIAKISNIEDITVSRKLPDILQISIVERIPRAFLISSRSQWVVDENCVVMQKQFCNNINNDMPVILGLDVRSSGVRDGMEIPEIGPALEMVMLSVRNFPDIRISAISVRNPEQLTCILSFREKQYKAFVPRKKMMFMLSVLRCAMIQAQESGDSRTVLDLNYNGNVILK